MNGGKVGKLALWGLGLVALANAGAGGVGTGAKNDALGFPLPAPYDTFSPTPPKLPPGAIRIGADQPPLFLGDYIYTHLNNKLVRFTIGQQKPDRSSNLVGFMTVWKDKIITGNDENIYILNEDLKTLKTIPLKRYGIPFRQVSVNEKYMLVWWHANLNDCNIISVYGFEESKFLWTKNDLDSSCGVESFKSDGEPVPVNEAYLRQNYVITREHEGTYQNSLIDPKSGTVVALEERGVQTLNPQLWKKFESATRAEDDNPRYDGYNYDFKYSSCKIVEKPNIDSWQLDGYKCRKGLLLLMGTSSGIGKNRENKSYTVFRETK